MCVALAGGMCASAQKGDIGVGLNAGYGTEIKNFGIGIKGQYNITDAIRAEAGFDYFLEKDGLSMWDVNLNVHYLFKVAENIKVYPLAGITYTNWKFSWKDAVEDEWNDAWAAYENEFNATYNELKQTAGQAYADMWAADVKAEYEQYKNAGDAYDESTGKFGVNVGAGVQYELTKNLVINLEGKYQIISDFNQAVFNVGVAYKF